MPENISYPEYVWWLIPERLAGMPRPPLEDLPRLFGAGLRGLVSVMDEPSGIDEYRQQGFQPLWLPTTGGQPPSVEQVREFVQFARPLLDRDQAVAVHCTSGNRRTGTLLAAYLIANRETPEDAIARVRRARPSAELREAQLVFLHELPQSLERSTQS